MMGGAGSFNAVGDHNFIDFIHDSVRDFFVTGGGFEVLGAGRESLQEGHIFVMNCCITYALFSSEMDHFYNSRIEADTASNTGSFPIVRGPKNPDMTRCPSNEDENSRRLPHREPLYRSISAGTSAKSFRSSTYHEHVFHARFHPRRLRIESVSVAASSNLSRRKIGKWLSDTSQSLGTWMLTTTAKVKQRVRKSSSSSIPKNQTSDADLASAVAESPRRSIPSMTVQNIHICHGQSPWAREIPVLLSYVVEMFDQHAATAEDEQSDTNIIVERLANPASWKRWLIVRDDLERSTTLLYYAAQRNLFSWVQYLIERDPLWFTKLGGRLNSPLIAAVNQGHLRVVSTFLDHLPSFDYLETHQDSSGKTILHHATMSADCLDAILNNSSIKSLDNENKLVDLTDMYSQTPLHLACRHGSLQVVRTLIRHKANVLLQDGNESTVLHHACYRPKIDLRIITTLLDAGASLDVPNKAGLTILQMLSDDERRQILEHAKRRDEKRSGKTRRSTRD
jgi:hypothetical protein